MCQIKLSSDLRAWNLRGRAQGLLASICVWSLAPFLTVPVGFGLCLLACPLPDCAYSVCLCLEEDIEICYSIIIGKHLDFEKLVTIMAPF